MYLCGIYDLEGFYFLTQIILGFMSWLLCQIFMLKSKIDRLVVISFYHQ